jgi:hypothetical protein
MKAIELAEQIKNTLQERGESYGSMYENHDRIANIWSVILGQEVTALQVVQCMIGVKLARLIQTPGHDDSWLDIAGYAGVGAECVDTLRRQEESK